MRSYNDERDSLSDLAYISCKNKFGLKIDILKNICLEARCTILNKFFKEMFQKQLSSKNLSYLASQIFKKNNGKLDLPEGIKINWDKNYIKIKRS